MSAFIVLITLTSALPASAAPALGVVADRPLEPELQLALQQQLRDVDVRLGPLDRAQDRVVSVAAVDSGYELSIRSGDGAPLLSRRLRADAALATTCALIVERFLADTGWAGLESQGLSVAPPPAPPASRPRTLELGAGALVTRGVDGGAGSFGPELDLWSRGSPVAWGLRAAWRLVPSRAVMSLDSAGPQQLGVLRTKAASLIASAGVCSGELPFGCLATRLGAIASWGRAEGADLYGERTVFGLQPAFGVSATGGVANLPLGLSAQLEISADYRFGTSRYAVQGVGEVLRAPKVEWGAALKLFRSLR